jgi:RNA polymerase sigma factor (sigma-70 family)
VAAAGDAGRAGDSVANATHDLYRQYGKQIYAYCLHQLRSREEAEDAVQTTFLNAFRGLQRGTTTRFEQAWLYKIAENVCIARRSSSGRRLRLEAPDDFEILEEVVPSGTRSAADMLELIGLDDALEQMPENQRRAILLREWQGLSYREIASQLDLSQGAVEMLIFRARRTLAAALEKPAAAKRRTGKAKTGFSFGSLIATMKGLFATGAAVKMAAVAVTAAVVGANAAIHSIVHRAVTQRPVRAAAAPEIVRAGSRQAAVRTSSVALVSWRNPRADVATHTAPVGSGPAAGSGAYAQKPVVIQDVSTDSTADRPPTTDHPAASSGSSPVQSVSLVVSPAPATTPAAPATRPVAPPAPTQAGSAGADASSGSQSSASSSGSSGGVDHGKNDPDVNGKGKGPRHPSGVDQPASPSTTPATTTTAASSDSSSSSDTTTTTAAAPTTATPTTTTTTSGSSSTTTTSTPSGGSDSSNGSLSSDSSEDSGNGKGGSNGNGGEGHHGHGH